MMKEFENDSENLTPQLVRNNENIKVFHRLFRKTLQPKTILRLYVVNSYIENSMLTGNALEKQKFRLRMENIAEIITLVVKKTFYEYIIIGCDFRITFNGVGFVFKVAGMSHQVLTFFKLVLQEIQKLQHSDNIRSSLKMNAFSNVFDNLNNLADMSSADLSLDILNSILDQTKPNKVDMSMVELFRQHLTSLSYKQIADELSDIIVKAKMTMLLVGNTPKQEALRIGQVITDFYRPVFKVDPSQTEEKIEADLEITTKSEMLNGTKWEITHSVLANTRLQFNKNHVHYLVRLNNPDPQDTNNTYLTYFEVEKSSVKTKILLHMVTNLFSPFAFQKLRDEQDLGYVVQAFPKITKSKQGLTLLLIGEQFRPSEVESRIDDLFKLFIKTIKEESLEKIDQTKNSVIDELTDFGNNLEDIAQKEWIFMKDKYLLQDNSDYFKMVDSISKLDLTNFMDDLLIKNQRRVTLEIFAHKMTEEEENYKGEPSIALGALRYKAMGLQEMLLHRDSMIEMFKNTPVKDI